MTGKTSIAPTRAQLADSMETAIITGAIAPGAKLPSERELAVHHGVSRPVVREAIRGLAARRLVDVVPGRGAYVRAADAADAASGMDALLRGRQPTPRDLVEARSMLETTAAALAAERAAAADLAAIDDALSSFDGAQNVIEQTRYDLAFHFAVARAAHNPVIETMFGAISGLTTELMLRSLGDPLVAPTSLPLHRTVADAIRARDPLTAAAAMKQHLLVAAGTYGDDYERSLESVARRELARLLDPSATLDDLFAGVLPSSSGEQDGLR